MVQIHGSGLGDWSNLAMVGDDRRVWTDAVISLAPVSVSGNPEYKYEYDDNNNLGSITMFIGTGSYVQVITWTGYSGTTIGLGSNMTNTGSWTA